MKYYIGVDGGGTKTVYDLFDENKNVIAETESEGTNHENLEGSYDSAAEHLMISLRQLLGSRYLDFGDVEAVLMGLAGMDHPYQINIMQKKLSERGLSSKLYIFNDGYIVIKAGSPKVIGIGYNCGTGTCCDSIASDGKMLQIGGFSELSGDMANGHWIARETWRSVYDDVCLGMRKTAMTDMFFDRFAVTRDREYFLDTVVRFHTDGAEHFIRGLIDIFFEALNSGDAAALALCDEMADRGAEFIAAHFRFQKFDDSPVPVVLSGSLHTKLPSEVYISMLKEKAAAKTGRELDFIILGVPPVVGCINWLLDGSLN